MSSKVDLKNNTHFTENSAKWEKIYFLLVNREKRCARACFENSNIYTDWEHMVFVAGLRMVESQSARSVTYRGSVVVEEKREYRIPLVN